MTGKSKFGPVDICLDLGTNVMYTFFPIERLLIPLFGYCGSTVFTVRTVCTRRHGPHGPSGLHGPRGRPIAVTRNRRNTRNRGTS